MTRFAGSAVSFDIPQFSPAASGGAAAAGSSTLAQNWASTRDKSVKFDELAAVGLNNASDERQQAMASEAQVASAGITAAAHTASAGITAKSNERIAAKQAQTAQTGMIAKAGIGLLTGIMGSDETMKNSIKDLDGAMMTLRQLRPVTYRYNSEWTDTPDRVHHGFIAQEYKEVLPDATIFDEEIGKYKIDQTDLISILVSAVQALDEKVARLEAKQQLAVV